MIIRHRVLSCLLGHIGKPPRYIPRPEVIRTCLPASRINTLWATLGQSNQNNLLQKHARCVPKTANPYLNFLVTASIPDKLTSTSSPTVTVSPTIPNGGLEPPGSQLGVGDAALPALGEAKNHAKLFDCYPPGFLARN